jgi:DNA-binding response OmpR family regulator
LTQATVLIVDSEAVEASELQGMLTTDGYAFDVVETAAQARQRIVDPRVRLSAILLDWELPGGSGLELLRWIKQEGGVDEVEVVVHASAFEPSQVRSGIENGAYYYLTKPFDGPQLEAIVRAAVSTHRLRSRLIESVRDTEDAFQLLDFGRFRFRTIPEGDLIAIHIASACKQPDAALGLRELMVNAVEHGNLGITYDEKSALMETGELESERERRLSLPENSDKRVQVTLQRILGFLEVTISDTGPGFDFCRYMTMDEDRLLDSHGRGVLMATATLEVEYLPPGNQVRIRLPMTNTVQRDEPNAK